MANLGNEVKTFLLKGLETIGDAASSISASARQKLQEMRVETRRDELRRQLPDVALKLWKEGCELPEQLSELLSELNELEEQLGSMRVKPEAPADEAAPTTFEEAMEELENKVEKAADAVEDWAESKVEAVKDAVKDAFTPDSQETQSAEADATDDNT